MTGLPDMLAQVRTRCTRCGICVSECAFLKLYGAPAEIAASHNPADPKKHAVAFECSLCSLCTAVCPEGADPAAMFLAMRRDAVASGAGVFAEHDGFIKYERIGMSPLFTWYGLPDGCDTVFFPGCALPGTRPRATFATYEMVRTSIPRLGVVLDCCGKPSHDLGRHDAFRAAFGELKERLLGHGVRRVLVGCPNCCKVFTEYAPELATRTVYEELASQDVPAVAPPVIVNATIHDPCVMRFNDSAQDAVRSLALRAGISIDEMPHSRRTALCCGEGGTVGALAPDLANRWASQRIDEAAGRYVVTCCAGCANNLGRSVPAHHILDIVTGGPDPARGPATYLNRLRLKHRFRRAVPSDVSGHRPSTSTAGRHPVVLLAALVAAIVAIRAAGIGRYLEPDELRALFDGFGIVAPLAYMLIFTIAPALMLPGLPITIAGATVFGPVWGVVYTIIGATAGACVAFLVARYAARDWVERHLVGSRWTKLYVETERNGWKAVAFTRLIPLFPFNLLNFAFGLTRIPFWQYALASFLFMLPGTIAFVTFSSSLLGLLKGTVSPEFFIGIALLAGVSLLPKLHAWHRKRTSKQAKP